MPAQAETVGWNIPLYHKTPPRSAGLDRKYGLRTVRFSNTSWRTLSFNHKFWEKSTTIQKKGAGDERDGW